MDYSVSEILFLVNNVYFHWLGEILWLNRDIRLRQVITNGPKQHVNHQINAIFENTSLVLNVDRMKHADKNV